MSFSGTNSMRFTVEQYNSSLQALHPALSVDVYLGRKVAITHHCEMHGGSFLAAPNTVLRIKGTGNRGGCPICKTTNRGLPRLTYTELDERIEAIHGQKVIMVGEYVSMNDRTSFECDHGHAWSAFPMSVIHKRSGCPICNVPRQFSRMATEWIRAMEKHLCCRFQHAGNKGEARIAGFSGRQYYVDGLSRRHSIVLEFNGDCWHGNCQRYKPSSKPNPFSDLTARQLTNQTLRRARDIARAGFEVVSVWETDWLNGKLISSRL